ncbi:hypothetical protein N9L68_05610 [bacterium]|nr:hypothetical protein [bacterium]
MKTQIHSSSSAAQPAGTSNPAAEPPQYDQRLRSARGWYECILDVGTNPLKLLVVSAVDFSPLSSPCCYASVVSQHAGLGRKLDTIVSKPIVAVVLLSLLLDVAFVVVGFCWACLSINLSQWNPN